MDLSFQLNSVLNNLCDKFGVTFDKLYPILIKQAYIDAICDLVCVIIFTIPLVLCLIKIYKNCKIIKMEKEKMIKIEDANSSEYRKCTDIIEYNGLTKIVCIAASSVLIVITSFILCDGVSILTNPEFYAIKNILDHIIH